MKSFLQGKNAVAVGGLRPLGGSQLPLPVCSVASAESSPHAGAARIEVVKDGGKVVRLIVHCSCGERVEVECLY